MPSDSWKAIAYEQMIEYLRGAHIVAVSEWMLGDNVKILIFEDNDKADKFRLILESIYENV